MENLVQRLLEYSTRPLTDFNKFDALSMFETLQNTAHDKQLGKENYYKFSFQTFRSKIDLPPQHFRNLLCRLIGDKDHQHIFEIVPTLSSSCTENGCITYGG